MRRIRRRSIAVIAAGALLALSGCDTEQPWSSGLVSAAADGNSSDTGASFGGVISPDGTKVVFVSEGDDLGPHDTNQQQDVYLRDLETGTTRLISVNATGTDAGSRRSDNAKFSPDGTMVAFTSEADDLVAADPWGRDIFVHDLASGVTSRVSMSSRDGDSTGYFVFSPDGSRIAFTFNSQIYLRHLDAGTPTLVSANPAGQPGNGESGSQAFSPDGTKLAFLSLASDLGPPDGNEIQDIYIRDLGTGTTDLVTVAAPGTGGANNLSFVPVFGPDGTKVAFVSDASNLGPADTNETRDVYMRDLSTATTTLISANADGTNGGNHQSDGGLNGPMFSPDGQDVLFGSSASDLGPSDTNGVRDVYLRNLATDATTLVSANASGNNGGNGQSSPTGIGEVAGHTRVLFSSLAHDLGPRDSNGLVDVYSRDLATGVTTLISANATGSDSGNAASDAHGMPADLISADGMRFVYHSSATDLGGTDTNRFIDVYVATLRSADLGVELSATPEPVGSGGTLTYRMGLVNDGPSTAEATTAALLLPEGTTFHEVTTTAGSCSPPIAAEPNLVKCSFDDAEVGEIATVTVTADVTAAAGAELTAIAGISSATVDEVSADNTAQVVSAVS